MREGSEKGWTRQEGQVQVGKVQEDLVGNSVQKESGTSTTETYLLALLLGNFHAVWFWEKG